MGQGVRLRLLSASRADRNHPTPLRPCLPQAPAAWRWAATQAAPPRCCTGGAAGGRWGWTMCRSWCKVGAAAWRTLLSWRQWRWPAAAAVPSRHSGCVPTATRLRVPSLAAGARQRFPGVRFELADGADLAALRALSPNNLGTASSNSSTSGGPSFWPASGGGRSGGGRSGGGRSSGDSASSNASSGSGSRSPLAPGGQQGSLDVICVDVSGKAPLQALVPLLAAYLREWPAARLIVKNEALFCAVEAWQRQRQQLRQDSGGSGAGDGRQQQQQQQQRQQQQQQQQQQRQQQQQQQRQQQQQQRQQQQRQQEGGQADGDTALLSQLLAGRRLEGGAGSGADGGGGSCGAARQLAAVLRECELFRSEGFLSHTDKPVNKAKDRR